MSRSSRSPTTSDSGGLFGVRGSFVLSHGVAGQGLRYVLVGGTVTLLYLATTVILADVVGLPFEVALTLGFCVALLVHFNLQRLFVWLHHEEFALSTQHQAGRYLLAAGVQYGITTMTTTLLPTLLGVSTEAVYLVTALLLSAGNFVLFRYGIFHAAEPVHARDEEPVTGGEPVASTSS